MKKLSWVLLVVLMLGFSGCFFTKVKQVHTDAKAGIETPRQEGETGNLPKDWSDTTRDVVGTVFPPAAGPAALAVLWITGFFRGLRLKKQQSPAERPATGFIGKQFGSVELLVQHASTVFAGLFGKSANGEIKPAGWKIPLVIGIGVALTSWSLSIPAVGDFAERHSATILGLLAGIPAILAEIEKRLAPVKPVQPSA